MLTNQIAFFRSQQWFSRSPVRRNSEPAHIVRTAAKATADELAMQAACYEAFFEVFWGESWFAGAYFWKWFPELKPRQVGNRGFTPQGKPAERVMARWYAGD